MVQWPGYPPFDHMILVRTQTPARNPMTLKRFLQHVGRKVQRFLAVGLSYCGHSSDSGDLTVIG
jgi:hypothetical protein